MRPRFCMCILNNPYPKYGVNVRVEVGKDNSDPRKNITPTEKKHQSHKSLPDPTYFFLRNITYKTGVSACP